MTVTNITPYAAVGVAGGVVVTGTVTPANSNAAIGLAITAGPAPAGSPSNASVTTIPATCLEGVGAGIPRGTFRCAYTAANANSISLPAQDTVMAFAENDGTTTYNSSTDVAATAVHTTIVGTPYRATITPATAHAAQNTCTASFVVTVTDNGGNPIPGIPVTISASQTASAAPAPTLTYCTGTPGAPGGSGLTTTLTDVTPNTNLAGQTVVGIQSDTTGTLTLTAASANGTALGNAGVAPNLATVTIDAGGNNSVSSSGLTAAPTSQSVFPGGNTVTIAYTLVNGSGDPVGGVVGGASNALAAAGVNARINSGPDAGQVVTCTTSADGTTSAPAGTGVCTYTTVSTSTVPDTGSDALTLWVNQTAGTTTGPDTGEPQATATVTVAAEPAFNKIVSTCDTAVVGPLGCANPTSTTSQVVTFSLTANGSNKTAEAGYTIDVSVDASPPSIGPISGAPFTLSAPSCVTASDGTCSVTVTDPTPTDTDKAVLTAAVHGDTVNAATLDDTTATVSWAPPQATYLVVTPESATNVAGATVTKTVLVEDQYLGAVPNVLVSWSLAAGSRNYPPVNSAASGTCLTGSNGTCTFSYTDAGGALTVGSPQEDTINVSATFSQTGPPSTVTISGTAYQYWVASGGTANNLYVKADSGAAVNAGDCGTVPGITNPPAAITGWAPTTATAPVSNITTLPSALACVAAVDANGLSVYGQPVTVTSSGVGQLLVANPAVPLAWTPSGVSATISTENGSGIYPAGTAIIGAQSTVPGTQTITFTAGGTVTASVTIVYTGRFAPLTSPQRLLDTRNGTGGLSVYLGGVAPVGPIAPGTIYGFSATQTNALSSGALAYAFNVTVVDPSAPGNLRVFACDTNPIPSTSTVNFQPGADTANAAIVTNTDDGLICLEASGGATNVVIDATGAFAGDLVPVTPSRLYDSRNLGNSPIAAGGTTAIQVGGVGGVPASGVKAVAINVTSILPSGGGNLAVYPDGAALPNTSNINYVTGVDKANFDVVALGADGKLDLHSTGATTNVAVDIIGYWTAASPLQVQTPVRILDTRAGSGIGTLTGPLTQGHVYNFTVTGAPGTGLAAVGASSVFGNLTAAYPNPGVGNLRIYPAGGQVPTTSNINYDGFAPVANFSMTGVGTNGQLSLVTSGGSVNALYDLGAWYPAGS